MNLKLCNSTLEHVRIVQPTDGNHMHPHYTARTSVKAAKIFILEFHVFSLIYVPSASTSAMIALSIRSSTRCPITIKIVRTIDEGMLPFLL